MRLLSVPVFISILLFLGMPLTKAQHLAFNTNEGGFETRDTITRHHYTLTFINKSATFADSVKQRLISTFFTVYPKMARYFNKHSSAKVTFIIDPSYTGVAGTNGHVVRFNPQWFAAHPGDIDVVTHEVMHIVQNYGRHGGPGWITEGIADFVRYKYGVDNKGGGWELPPYSDTQSYTNSYRVTARFLIWIEKNVRRDFVRELDKKMRTHKYTADTWKELTGKTVDELWQQYGRDPAI